MNSVNDYVIAIPSYKRDSILNKKTLSVLNNYNIPKSKIYVFVANNDEHKKYSDTLDPENYGHLIIGKKGIKEIRNFMANYFDENQKIVYMDDDIGRIWECVNSINPYDKKNNKTIELSCLDTFLRKAFKESLKTGYSNWGVYPRDNPYFMKPTSHSDHLSKDLKFLIGFLTGVTNNKKAEVRTISDKEDYERTIKYYLKDGGVLRFNNISCYTRCYKVPGGIQADRKKEVSERNANILINKYPNLVSINNGRNSPFVEIRLRDKTKSKSFKSKIPIRSNRLKKLKKSKKLRK